MHLPYRRIVYSFGLALALVSLLAACGGPSYGTQTGGLGTTPGAGAGNAGPESTSEVGGSQGQAGGAGAGLPTATTGAAGNAPLGGTAAVGQSTEATGGTTGTLGNATEAAGGTSGTGGNATQAAGGLGGNATEAAGGTSGTGNMVPVPPGELEPCTLLTKSEVESAVGMALNEPTRSADQNNVLSCNYASASSPATMVNFALFQGPDQTKIAEQTMTEPSNQTVTGVGDQAVQTANGLFVKSGDMIFSIQITMPNQPDKNSEVATQLATLVLQHLASATAVPTEAATP